MSSFKFIDSGIEIEIERVSFVMLEMVGAAYQSNFPNKPEVPVNEIKDGEGNVLERIELPLDPQTYKDLIAKPNVRDQDKVKYQEDLARAIAYNETKKKWDADASAAQWQATRLLYAKHLKSKPDLTLVQRVIKDAAQFGADLQKQILGLYAKHQVPFEDEYMDAWIYLWCVCAASVSDSALLNNWMQNGSSEARQAISQALFPIRYSV